MVSILLTITFCVLTVMHMVDIKQTALQAPASSVLVQTIEISNADVSKDADDATAKVNSTIIQPNPTAALEQEHFDGVMGVYALAILLFSILSITDYHLYWGATDRSVALCTAWLHVWITIGLVTLIFLSPIFFASMPFSVTCLTFLVLNGILVIFIAWVVVAFCAEVAEVNGREDKARAPLVAVAVDNVEKANAKSRTPLPGS